MARLEKSNFKLKEIEGTKFRVMWSTKILYTLLFMTLVLIIFISFNDIITHRTFSIDFHELAPIIFIFCPFLLLISIINNKFLGTIVAVINEEGIYTKNGLIPWSSINEICYKINMSFSRSHDKFERYCCLEIYSGGNEYRILHAPHKMVRHIRKNVPDVKVKKDKEFIAILTICIGILFIISVINKFKR